MGKKRLKSRPKKLSVDVVETQQISLVDEFGTERASFFCQGGNGGRKGHVVIQLKGDNGRPRLELQVEESGSCIRLLNDNDSSGVSIAVNYGQSNGLGVSDEQGKPLIQLGIPHKTSNDPRGPHPDIFIFDEDAGRFWSASENSRNTREL